MPITGENIILAHREGERGKEDSILEETLNASANVSQSRQHDVQCNFWQQFQLGLDRTWTIEELQWRVWSVRPSHVWMGSELLPLLFHVLFVSQISNIQKLTSDVLSLAVRYSAMSWEPSKIQSFNLIPWDRKFSLESFKRYCYTGYCLRMNFVLANLILARLLR